MLYTQQAVQAQQQKAYFSWTVNKTMSIFHKQITWAEKHAQDLIELYHVCVTHQKHIFFISYILFSIIKIIVW